MNLFSYLRVFLVVFIFPLTVFSATGNYNYDHYSWENRNNLWDRHPEDCPYHNGVLWPSDLPGFPSGSAHPRSDFGYAPPSFSYVLSDINDEYPNVIYRPIVKHWQKEGQGVKYVEIGSEIFFIISFQYHIFIWSINDIETDMGYNCKNVFGFPLLTHGDGKISFEGNFLDNCIRRLYYIPLERLYNDRYINLTEPTESDLADVDYIQTAAERCGGWRGGRKVRHL